MSVFTLFFFSMGRVAVSFYLSRWICACAKSHFDNNLKLSLIKLDKNIQRTNENLLLPLTVWMHEHKLSKIAQINYMFGLIEWPFSTNIAFILYLDNFLVYLNDNCGKVVNRIAASRCQCDRRARGEQKVNKQQMLKIKYINAISNERAEIMRHIIKSNIKRNSIEIIVPTNKYTLDGYIHTKTEWHCHAKNKTKTAS